MTNHVWKGWKDDEERNYGDLRHTMKDTNNPLFITFSFYPPDNLPISLSLFFLFFLAPSWGLLIWIPHKSTNSPWREGLPWLRGRKRAVEEKPASDRRSMNVITMVAAGRRTTANVMAGDQARELGWGWRGDTKGEGGNGIEEEGSRRQKRREPRRNIIIIRLGKNEGMNRFSRVHLLCMSAFSSNLSHSDTSIFVVLTDSLMSCSKKKRTTSPLLLCNLRDDRMMEWMRRVKKGCSVMRPNIQYIFPRKRSSRCTRDLRAERWMRTTFFLPSFTLNVCIWDEGKKDASTRRG